MKKILLNISRCMLVGAVMLGMTTNVAKAIIDNPENAKAGEIYRWESNSPGDFEQLCKPENGVYGIFVYAADAADWDSQFFWVFQMKLFLQELNSASNSNTEKQKAVVL